MLKIIFIFLALFFINLPLIPAILLLGIVGFMVKTKWIAFIISIVILILTSISFGIFGYLTIFAYIISIIDAINVKKFMV